ncbi:MAG TPA: putative toxin-antitoxin system toxin component, PIN family [Clostridiales bacterium]|nr:putative toxin-antitoxin system toxin component, PIN family [Clostridiales bacterium]
MSRLIEKAVEDYTLVLSTYVVEELKSVVDRKFPSKMKAIEKFLTALSYELVYSHENYDGTLLFEIRDGKDYMVLHTAIIADVDILITGDKDFKDIGIERPEILTPKEFLDKY